MDPHRSLPGDPRQAGPARAPDDDEPHHVVLTVAESDTSAAAAVLDGDPDVVAWARTAVGGGTVELRVSSVRSPRFTAVARVLNGWRRQGVHALAMRPDDAVTDVPSEWLDAQLRGWAVATANRRRLESLAGPAALEQLLARVQDPNADAHLRRVAAWACGHVVLNSQDVAMVARIVEVAARLSRTLGSRYPYPQGADVENLVDAAAVFFQLSELVPAPALRSGAQGGPGAPERLSVPWDESLVRELVGHSSTHLSWRTLQLVASSTGTVQDATAGLLVTVALRWAEKRGPDAGVIAATAAAALARCPVSPTLTEALEALRRHDQAETRITAGVVLARLGGRDTARALWREMLASRSAVEKFAAYALIAELGTEEDVDDAVLGLRAALGSSMRTIPPQGIDLIQFLVRHGVPSLARGELDRARRRKAGTDPALEAWLERTVPELAR